MARPALALATVPLLLGKVALLLALVAGNYLGAQLVLNAVWVPSLKTNAPTPRLALLFGRNPNGCRADCPHPGRAEAGV